MSLVRWSGLRRSFSDRPKSTVVLRNASLDGTFYCTKKGHFYSASSRVYAVQLLICSISAALNPSCDDVFMEACGDSQQIFLDFLQYACLPSPARVQQCPPGRIFFPSTCLLYSAGGIHRIRISRLRGRENTIWNQVSLSSLQITGLPLLRMGPHLERG